jgi:hypothetical protein
MSYCPHGASKHELWGPVPGTVLRVFTLWTSPPCLVVYLGLLIQATEFTGMLEGYEQVRAYCYNCE